MPYAALCFELTAPTNGGVTSTGISIGDTATYTCDVGFELVGTATATCTAAVDGNSAGYTPAAPTCRRRCFLHMLICMYIMSTLLL